MTLKFEDIDLAQLACALVDRFGGALDEDYLDGRTIVRDAIVSLLGCSALEAEELVDTLEAREYLRFPTLSDETHPNQWSHWEIGARPSES